MQKLNELFEQATEISATHGSEWSSALCQGADDSQAHAIICESRDDIVISTHSSAKEASWLCDYLELCSPANILAIAKEVHDLKKRAEAAEAKLAAMPSYFLNRIESSDKWGPEVELRLYENHLDAMKSQGDHGGGVIELFTRPAPAVSLEELNVRRDAIRYRFLRESDFFGEDNEPGLASWDELSELDCNEFDAAVDARMNHPESLYPIILRNIEESK